jgi:hypothetical protein
MPSQPLATCNNWGAVLLCHRIDRGAVGRGAMAGGLGEESCPVGREGAGSRGAEAGSCNRLRRLVTHGLPNPAASHLTFSGRRVSPYRVTMPCCPLAGGSPTHGSRGGRAPGSARANCPPGARADGHAGSVTCSLHPTPCSLPPSGLTGERAGSVSGCARHVRCARPELPAEGPAVNHA